MKKRQYEVFTRYRFLQITPIEKTEIGNLSCATHDLRISRSSIKHNTNLRQKICSCYIR